MYLHVATFISSDQPRPVQSPSNQSNHTLLRFFWFHWFRSGQCYCLLLFVLSMLLFAWFLKWRKYLCGTVFILLKCTRRADSLDVECLWHTGPIATYKLTHSIIKRKFHPLFLPPSLPRLLLFSGGSECRCRMSSVLSWREMHHFPFKQTHKHSQGICVLLVFSQSDTEQVVQRMQKIIKILERLGGRCLILLKGSVAVYFWNVEHVLLWQSISLDSSFMFEWVL